MILPYNIGFIILGLHWDNRNYYSGLHSVAELLKVGSLIQYPPSAKSGRIPP